MAENDGQMPTQVTPVVPPVKPEATGQQQQEPQTFSREYVHELREEAKRYRLQQQELAAKVEQFENAQKQQQEAELAQKGEWQKIAEQREQELKTVQATAEMTSKKAAVIAAAAKAGFTDPMDAVKMLDLSNFKIENDTITGLEDALAELTKAKPYLLKTQPAQEQGQGQQQRKPPFGATNPAGGASPYTTSVGEGGIGGVGVIRKS